MKIVVVKSGGYVDKGGDFGLIDSTFSPSIFG